MKKNSSFRHYFRNGSCKINGLTVRANGRTKLIWASLLALAFFPFLYIISDRVLYDVDYSEVGVNELDDNYISEWRYDDPRLIEHIRKYYLIPPAVGQPYQLDHEDKRDYSHKMQSTFVEQILHHKRDGFFVESGAYDGETYSNSLSFEKYLNWTGLLVEPDYANFKKLRSKNRKAWTMNACLDGVDRPQKMLFYGAMDAGWLQKHDTFLKTIFTRLWRPVRAMKVWCFPLYSILLAMNRTHIDYLALDIEGPEIAVLQRLPFDKITADVIQVEFMICQGIYWDVNLSEERKAETRRFMREKLPQYKEKMIVLFDMIYVKENLLTKSDDVIIVNT